MMVTPFPSAGLATSALEAARLLASNDLPVSSWSTTTVGPKTILAGT
jgi:hypothetical protein